MHTLNNNLAKAKGFVVQQEEGKVLTYIKDNFYIWMSVSGWQTAYRVDGEFINYKVYHDLDSALSRVD